MRYLKTRKDSDALAYQRHIGKRLKARARAMSISDPVVMPLSLKRGAPDKLVAAELDQCNDKFETLMRFIAQTDIRAVQAAEMEAAAAAYIEIKGRMPGDLYGIESDSGLWDDTIDTVFEHYQHQDHPQFREVYPDAKLMPPEFRDAILAILKTRDYQKQFVLYSEVLDAYKAYRRDRIERDSATTYEANRKLKELKKEIQRLDDFYAYVGNREFTADNCNTDLHKYRRHLLDHYDKPATAKRNHEMPCAAFRWYADEYVPAVVIKPFKFPGQKAKTRIRPVFDIQTELPQIWAAAHDPTYHHLFRLAAFGVFAGAGASELIQTTVSDVRPRDGYYMLGGSKTAHRSRPAIILNSTHERLLLKHGKGSIAGEKTANQTSSHHSKIIKDGLVRATGNEALSAYSGRHTGKYLCDVAGVGSTDAVRVMFGWHEGNYAIANNYGRAGHFSKPMIDEMKAIVASMTQDLPDLNHLDRVPLNTGNVLQMRW